MNWNSHRTWPATTDEGVNGSTPTTRYAADLAAHSLAWFASPRPRHSRFGEAPAMLRLGACLGMALACFAAPASATSLTGTFGSDDALFITSFAVAGPESAVATFRSYGYAGGVNMDAQVIPRGGFDPIVSVFTDTGTLIGLSDDGIGVPLDAVSGQGGDSLLTLFLAPGSYRLVLTEYDNFPNGDFNTGFSRVGEGNFSAGTAGCTAASFCDGYGFARTANWALDISLVAVPEPTTGALTLAGLALLGLALRGKQPRSAPGMRLDE